MCEPRLSIRARRGRVVVASCSAAVGLVALLALGPWGPSFVSPGALSAAHGGIATPDGAGTNCAACHNAAEAGFPGWVSAALSGGARLTDSDRCLGCHFEQDPVGRAHALLPHSEKPERLAQTTAEISNASSGSGTTLLSLASLAGGPPRGEIACATCHQEHRGRNEDLVRMSNTRCQVCHQNQFADFAGSHPAFGGSPEPSRGRIAFDHASHTKDDHFGKTEFSCQRCHATDRERKTMLVEPFVDSCAGCHSGGRTDHHGAKIKDVAKVMLQLPYMEFDEAEIYWPDEAAQGEELTPLMLVLLAGDDAALEPLRLLEEEGDEPWIPEYWYPDDDEPKVELATAIKRLVLDLATGDASALSRRIALALQGDPADPEIAALTEQLTSAKFALVAFQQGWLPELPEDLRGQQFEPANDSAPDWKIPQGTSGWYVDSGAAAVSYRPRGHADPFLKSWIDALAAYAAGQEENNSDDAGDFRRALLSGLFESARSRGFLRTACLRCHAVDQAEAGYRVNWAAAGRREASGYTKFTHAPHLTAVRAEQTCAHCHQVADPTAEAAELALGMLPQGKETCAGCHAAGHARDDCLTCHTYHASRP